MLSRKIKSKQSPNDDTSQDINTWSLASTIKWHWSFTDFASLSHCTVRLPSWVLLNEFILTISKLICKAYQISFLSHSFHNQYWYFFVFWPFDFLSSDWIDLYNVMGNSVVVQHGSDLTAKRTSNELEERQFKSRIVIIKVHLHIKNDICTWR